MATEICNGDLKTIDWKSGLLRSVYLSKSNCIVSSLTNDIVSSVTKTKYNLDIINMLNDIVVYPMELAFLKRSQLLSRRFEDLEDNKLKIYEESGMSQGEEDYTVYKSRVRCHQCHLNHTSFHQLQTRSADEPMTIFWYCYKCKIRGRQ
jgi:DNA-directed RNA polymerase subunit M/transcription elongation factor TFIIS